MQSEDCMESCLKMMGKKEMDLTAGKAGIQGMNKMDNLKVNRKLRSYF